MAQLIDKSAVVAEINKLRKYQRLDDRHDQGVLDGLHAIERFIDTLEVKEVDIEEEYRDYINCDNGHTAFEIAKYFFELGLKAQKGE